MTGTSMTNKFNTQEHDYRAHSEAKISIIAMSKRRACVGSEEACLSDQAGNLNFSTTCISKKIASSAIPQKSSCFLAMM